MPGPILDEEEEDEDENLNDVVEVGAEDDVEEQQGRRGGDIGEAAHVVQEGGASEEEALVPTLNLPPIDSLPPFLLESEADLLQLLHGSSPQSSLKEPDTSILRVISKVLP